MRIYNSKSLSVEEFVPLKEKEVRMYVCGPTVYNDVHIGNVRPVVVFDTLRRVFEALDYKVYYVSNYTDIDDKIINEAKRRNISEKELTDEMILAYNKIRSALNAQSLYKTPRVSETIDEIISFISKLIENGSAYEKDGDVYFKVESVSDYGSLSRQNLEDLKVGARIEENTIKESPLDFVLWKKTDEGMRWQSPFSVGRPGWHTECVVMIQDNLGELIDIHGGGKDLRFPHHENERAQSLACCKSELANYWMHSGMIDIDGVKMSKSLGNFITAKEILNRLDGNSLRWFLLATHYRADLNVSDEIIASSIKELDKVKDALKKSDIQLSLNDFASEEYNKDFYASFMEQMEDDLNTANAYAVIFENVKELNQALRQKDIDMTTVSSLNNSLRKCLNVLGIEIEKLILNEEDKSMYLRWLHAKEEKDFELADRLRENLQERGLC